MAFEREKQSVPSSDILQAIADGEDIQLSQCTITGILDIGRLFHEEEKFDTSKLDCRQNPDSVSMVLPQSVVFDKCDFEENMVFSGPWSKPDSISVEFQQDVIFNSSHFLGQARFRGAVFHGIAGFDGCTFDGVVTFKNAEVKKDAKFRTATFKGYSLFGNAVFDASTRFTNSHFVKGVNFSDVYFKGYTDFNGVYSSSRAVPAYEGVRFGRKMYGDDESFWRFVKQSAQEAGYYQLSGECFYHEMCSGLRKKLWGVPGVSKLSFKRKMVRLIKGIRLLPEYLFGKLLFGYGERPVRVLFASAIIILLCALYYSQPGKLMGELHPEQPEFIEGLYFSTITFTTLGFGDIYPAADGSCRFVAMLEATSGFALMGLFVVCLSKRFSRG